MKTCGIALVLILLAVLLSPETTRADDWDDALRGGLIGAALGAVIGNNSHGISTGEGAAIGAATGALFGYAYDDDGYRYSPYDYGRYRRYRRHHYPYALPRDYYWDRPRIRYWYPPRDVVHRQTKTRQEHVVPQPADPHPGVKLHFVPVTLSRGVSLSLRIIETGGVFVGPQGEIYEELPTAETLEARYAVTQKVNS